MKEARLTVSVIIPVYNSESTIRATLESVLAQKNIDLEVICVDDCSSDKSVSVIQEIAEHDERIKLLINEKNEGVSGTRNRGIDAASGEYVRFCDADDFFPKDSTLKMLDIARKKNSDLVVGIMEGSRGARAVKFSSTSAVAKKKVIKKYDPLLTRSFSVCNKMFNMRLIRENDIRFRAYKHAEDGLFLYEFLHYASKINGCDSIVYTYSRPATFLRKTATANLSKETLKGILEISDKILDMHQNAPSEFYESLNKRILSATLLEKYYIRLWHLDEETLEQLKSAVLTFKERIPLSAWEKIVNEHLHLRLEKMLFTHDDVAENALFSIIINDKLDPDTISNLLGSLYFQKTPFFRVISAAPKENIPYEYRAMKNLQFIQGGESTINNIVKQCTTPYICFVDDRMMFSYNSLAKAAQILIMQSDAGYVTGLCQRIINGKLVTPDPYKFAFPKSNEGWSRECLVYDRVDHLLSNKIFRTDILRKIIGDRTDLWKIKVNDLAGQMIHGRFRAIRYIIDYSDEELMEKLFSHEER